MTCPTLKFDQGTITLEGVLPHFPPHFAFDERGLIARAPGMYYSATKQHFAHRGIEIADKASRITRLPLDLQTDYEPHPYQEQALKAWVKAGGRGSVILPTGAGKTLVALKAMERAGGSTLVVSPTINLMNQWYALLVEAFGTEVGILGGGYHEIRPITVTTYDSAYIHAGEFGNLFFLLIFDEVHHLPAAKFRQVADMCIAPHRMGLTATYERQDGAHACLEELVGPVIFRQKIGDLKGKYLAEYQTVRIKVRLSDEEAEAYKKACADYYGFIRAAGIKPFGEGWIEFLKMSGYDERARRALVAKQEVKRLSLNAERKLEVLDSLLKQHCHDQTVVFTERNDLVYRISREFLIPAITHQTRTRERKWVLDGFKSGTFNAIVTSKVLNEGVDVPSAKVAIILGGSASPREHVQRLGRILRKGGSRNTAVLYEVVTSATAEGGVSSRRRKSDAYA
jgi:superfamily II DNA or RNA helicase